jgi:hypothetical protein
LTNLQISPHNRGDNKGVPWPFSSQGWGSARAHTFFHIAFLLNDLKCICQYIFDLSNHLAENSSGFLCLTIALL